MEIVRLVLERRNPEYDKHVEDEDDKEEMEQTEWWKTKKWAIKILLRMFERYGSPGGVTKEYKSFANWYLNTFSSGALQVIFSIMDSFRKGDFVSKKVLRDGLLYLKVKTIKCLLSCVKFNQNSILELCSERSESRTCLEVCEAACKHYPDGHYFPSNVSLGCWWSTMERWSSWICSSEIR